MLLPAVQRALGLARIIQSHPSDDPRDPRVRTRGSEHELSVALGVFCLHENGSIDVGGIQFGPCLAGRESFLKGSIGSPKPRVVTDLEIPEVQVRIDLTHGAGSPICHPGISP